MTFVLGYDESPGAALALDTALELAARFDETLVLVYGAAPPGGLGEEYAAHRAALEELGRAATAHALERAKAAGVAAEVEIVPAKPAEALLDVADRRDARMIVVGSYGESPLRGVILGSTTYKVLNQSSRPVLVVKA
ncbi:universal stress protein [Pengzhenrongella sicca]|uniref:Universal stress protein n=1 Tax=Pengzhenrongella sicca TaxID=2819238 RepID=A0A8A4ZA64_9MICO|nr:universal stress protein [Pengzhenrongella sicca]QTE27919.1 universal stress protein [Pengzhenrongella sicca]